MPTPDLAIGDRARQVRTRLGLNQSEVAERVGISVEVYGRFERGQVTPRISTLLKLCTVLKVTPNDLLIANGPRAARNTQAASGAQQVLSILENATPATVRRVTEVARWLVAGEASRGQSQKKIGRRRAR